MDVKDIIKTRRIELGLTMKEISEKIGVSEGTISRWESGEIANMRRDKIMALSKALKISPSIIMGWDDAITEELNRPTRTVKIYGKIAGGQPIEMIENVIDEVDLSTLPEKYDGHYFGLQINGTSMEPEIRDGDYIICVEAEDAESGTVVAVTVNGENATCKRLMKYEDGIRLVPINPACEVRYFTNEEIKSLPVKVIGKVIESRHRFK